MTRIGILGYGNLGRGVELAVRKNEDQTLVGVFTRRNPQSVKTALDYTKVYSADDLPSMQGEIDVLVICGGSATDLPEMTPKYARLFNVVDSFDTHARIPEHFENVNRAALEAGKSCVISAGWDPGLFSVSRLYSMSVLPDCTPYTFWGKGVSQGHSDAIRRIEGVEDARQYTIPVEAALESVRAGENPVLTTRQKHTRECFVVAKEGADKARIEKEIVEMPNYFADYDTTVHFISKEELMRDHAGLPHGGSVLCSGTTGKDGENHHVIEYRLKLDSNPEFTGSVLAAVARACDRFCREGNFGAKTMFDIAPAYLSPFDGATLRAKYL